MKKTTSKKQIERLESRPEQISTEGKPQFDFALRRANRGLNTDDLLSLLRKDAPRFFELAEVVGSWVWITFDEKQPPEITAALSQYGFHWNNARQAWQHPCGTLPERERKDFDPRKFLIASTKAMADICRARFEAFGSAGQASKIKAVSCDKMAERYKKGELAQIVK